MGSIIGSSYLNQEGKSGNAMEYGNRASQCGCSFSPLLAQLRLSIVIVMPILIVVIIYILDKRQARIQQEQVAEIEKEHYEKRAKRREKRCRSIEKGLISKQIADHDELCDIARRCKEECSGETTTVPSPPSPEIIIPNLIESVPREGVPSECPICFEKFKAGDIVSWASLQCCRHVFHHLCIKEWLQRQKECPLCREICLPMDRDVDTLSQEMIKEKHTDITLVVDEQYRSSHCFYCIEHGIVSIPVSFTSASISIEKLESIQHRARQCPSLKELANIRVLHQLPAGA